MKYSDSEDAMLDAAQVRRIAAREHDRALRALVSASDSDLVRPSRCAGWTVGDVAAHLGLAVTLQADAYRRALEGRMEPPEFPGAPQLAANDIRNLVRSGAADLDAALGELVAADDAAPDLIPLPVGILPTPLALQVTAYEVAFHADDVGSGLGHAPTLEPDIATGFIGFLPILSQMMASAAEPGTAGFRYELVAPSGTVVLAPGASAHSAAGIEVCRIAGDDAAIALFVMGRIDAEATGLAVSGAAAMHAGAFKRWFPGP